MGDCFGGFAKCLLIFFNTIFFLAGAAILAIGIWVKVDSSSFLSFEFVKVAAGSTDFDIGIYILIAFGAFIFLVGFLGCCGAIKENKCCLGLYIFFLVIVLAGLLAGGIYVLIKKDFVIKETEDGLIKKLKTDNIYTLKPDGSVENTVFGLAVNLFQVSQKCCGVNGSADYQGSVFVANRTDDWKFPFTCCPLKATAKVTDPQIGDVDNAKACQAGGQFKIGCSAALQKELEANSLIIIGVGIGIGCLPIFGMIFSICLCRHLTKNSD